MPLQITIEDLFRLEPAETQNPGENGEICCARQTPVDRMTTSRNVSLSYYMHHYWLQRREQTLQLPRLTTHGNNTNKYDPNIWNAIEQ